MSCDLHLVGTAGAAAAPGTSQPGSEGRFDGGGGLLFLPVCSVQTHSLQSLVQRAAAHSADANQEGQIERCKG